MLPHVSCGRKGKGESKIYSDPLVLPHVWWKYRVSLSNSIHTRESTKWTNGEACIFEKQTIKPFQLSFHLLFRLHFIKHESQFHIIEINSSVSFWIYSWRNPIWQVIIQRHFSSLKYRNELRASLKRRTEIRSQKFLLHASSNSPKSQVETLREMLGKRTSNIHTNLCLAYAPHTF